MAKRKNDITLTPTQLKRLVSSIEKCFRQYNITIQKFTSSRTLKIYDVLQDEIEKFGGIKIGKTTLIETMTLKRTKPFRTDIYDALRKYVTALKIAIKSPNALGGQRIFWGVNQGLDPGAFIERLNGEFIPWPELKRDLETKVITQCPRIIPVGARVETSDFYNKDNWVVHIIDTSGKKIGSIWIGGNPAKNWEQDGYIRIGKSNSDTEWVVYQILARFPDGSYRIRKSFV
jgi:hypothetical protein